MAKNATTVRTSEWESAFNRYQDIRMSLATSEAKAHKSQELSEALAEQIDLVLELPAPSLTAVIQKLHLLWEADLQKPDRDATEKSQIIEDLHELAAEIGQATGLQLAPQIAV